jgi:hypothetical protein
MGSTLSKLDPNHPPTYFWAWTKYGQLPRIPSKPSMDSSFFKNMFFIKKTFQNQYFTEIYNTNQSENFIDFSWTSEFLHMETKVWPMELIGILVKQSTLNHETIYSSPCLFFDNPL